MYEVHLSCSTFVHRCTFAWSPSLRRFCFRKRRKFCACGIVPGHDHHLASEAFVCVCECLVAPGNSSIIPMECSFDSAPCCAMAKQNKCGPSGRKVWYGNLPGGWFVFQPLILTESHIHVRIAQPRPMSQASRIR